MGHSKPKVIYWKPGVNVPGEQVYLDANFLVALGWPPHVWHASAKALQTHFEEQGTKLLLSSLAFNEAIYQLKSFEQKAAKAGQNPPEVAAKPEPNTDEAESEEAWDDNDFADEPDLRQYRLKVAKPAPRIKRELPAWAALLEQAVKKIPNVEFFEPPDIAFHLQVVDGVYRLRLDPTDSFHYAVAHRLNCPLVSNDAGFQKIPDINLTVVTFF